MNLLNDLSSELAVAILVEKKHSEKVNSNDALNLIGKVYEILHPISSKEEAEKLLPQTKETASTNH